MHSLFIALSPYTTYLSLHFPPSLTLAHHPYHFTAPEILQLHLLLYLSLLGSVCHPHGFIAP